MPHRAPTSLVWVTPVAPGAPSGQAQVLDALLEGDFGRRSTVLTTDRRLASFRQVPGDTTVMQFRASLAGRVPVIGRLVVRLVDAINIAYHSIRLIGHIRRNGATAVVATTAGKSLLPAAWVASRWTRSSLVAYLFDDPVYQWLGTVERRHAAKWERRWSRDASAIVVPNEFLGREFTARTGCPHIIVRNAVRMEVRGGESELEWPSVRGELSIVYTGSIYHAQLDTFDNLIAAIKDLDTPTRLHVYTSQTEDELASMGLVAGFERHDHLDRTAIQEVQRRADILWLPLAFRSPSPTVIATAAPGKLGEYLASGRPVLVNAPADSFTSWFCREHRCAYVVSDPGASSISAAIEEIEQDAQTRRSTVGAASRLAVQFSHSVARAQICTILNGVTAHEPTVR